MKIAIHLVWRALGVALLALATTAVPTAATDAGDDAASPEAPAGETQAEPAPGPAAGTGRAASWVTVDPDTGEPRAGRLDDAGHPPLSPRLEEWLSRRTDGLYEQALPGGGFAVDLQGRFRSLTVVRIDDQGEVETRCLEAAPQGARGTQTGERPAVANPAAADPGGQDHE